MRKLLDWRAALIYSHRWLGIALGLLFVAWFVSGVAFMYWGMPSLSEAERLDRQSAIDLGSAEIAPAEAARRHGITPTELALATHDSRPVYLFDGTRPGEQAVYADTGELVHPALIGRDEAVEIIRQWVPEHAATVRYDRYLDDSDQWTLQNAQRSQMPLHRIAVGDTRGTRYYVAEATGNVAMKTDRETRIKGFVSGVLHWVYFVPLRKHNTFWAQFVIWSSLVGALMCLLGLVLGVWRLSRTPRYGRRKGQPSRSPYAGLMRWHHYFGLAFGLVAFTWAVSGAFSLNPYGMFSGGPSFDRPQQEVVSGGPFQVERLGVEALRDAIAAFGPHFAPKEAEVLQFRGELYLAATRPATAADRAPAGQPPERRMVALSAPERGAFTRFDDAQMEAIAAELMAGIPVRDSAWLHEYDNYYRSREGTRPLPVLRARYLDEYGTWLYLDPHHGQVTVQHRISRARRWLYNGLHSLDFPFLYDRRPLWDIVVILLSIGGIVLSASTLWPSAKRIGKHIRRWARRPRASDARAPRATAGTAPVRARQTAEQWLQTARDR